MPEVQAVDPRRELVVLMWLGLAAGLLLLCVSCSGASGMEPSTQPALNTLLPAPDHGTAAASLFGAQRDGAEYAADLPHARCEADGTAAVLTPSAADTSLAGAAYAVYRLRCNAATPELLIHWDGLSPAGCWLGLANWQSSRWDWQPLPATSSLDLGQGSPYADASQHTLVAVVLTSGDPRQLVNISFPADDPAQTFVAQASATLSEDGKAFNINATDLPDGTDILFGQDSGNPNVPVDNHLVLTYPYRGGTNEPAASHLSIKTSPGVLGLTVAGLVIYGASNASTFNINGSVYTYDANAAKINGEDQYGGHASPQNGGQYHYHDVAFISRNAWVGVPGFSGVYEQADGHSKLVGWAEDGYPIYGPYGYVDPLDPESGVTKMVSGYTATNTGANRPAAVSTTASAASNDSEFITLPSDPGGLGTDPGMRLTEINGVPTDNSLWIVNQKNVHYTGGGHPPYMGPTNSVMLNAKTTIPSGATLKFEFLPGAFIEDESFTGGGTLDEYNGRYCVTPDYPEGTYAYFCTMDDEGEGIYPYMLGQALYGDPTVGGTPGSGYVKVN